MVEIKSTSTNGDRNVVSDSFKAKLMKQNIIE